MRPNVLSTLFPKGCMTDTGQQTRTYKEPFTLLSYIFDLVSFLTSILTLAGVKTRAGFQRRVV